MQGINNASYSIAGNSTDTSLNSNECRYIVNSSETSNDEQIPLNNTKHSLSLVSASSSSSSANDTNETLSLSSHRSSSSNNNRNDANEERKFNDTLEEVEFLIEQGIKIKALEQKTTTPLTPTSNDKTLNNLLTPESRKTTPKTPNTVISKSKYQTIQHHSPMDKYFKKPPIFTHQPSRIPKPQHQRFVAPHTVTNNKRFDHIVSPISQYIKSGQSPLVKNIQAGYENNFFDSSYCQQLNFTQDSINNDSILSMDKTNSVVSLPRKAFIATDYCQMYDNRTIKMPGGASVQRLVGDVPYAIKHEGRIQMGIANHQPQQQPQINDSFADLSIMPGDLSIQVVKNVERI